MDIYISTKDLREIILGKITYRKCPNCDQNGNEHWDDDGRTVLPAPLPGWKEYGSCQNCNGLGYIQNTSE